MDVDARWMRVYGARAYITSRIDVDDLVAVDSQDRRAENLLALGVDDDLHEALRLALLDRSPDLRHRAFADEDLLAGRLRRGLGHADAAERRIDEQGIGVDPVSHPAPIAVEQVGRDDLVVVVRRVRERAPPVAVPRAQMPGTLVRSSSSTMT